MFTNGTVGNGGPYDGIVTLNSAVQYHFNRPVSGGNFDAQLSTEHEIDEVIGLGSHASLSNLGLRTCSVGHLLLTAGGLGAAVIDFNGDGHPDYVLQNVSTLQRAIWYLNNNVFISGAYGPTLPAGWSLIGQ